MNTTNDAIDNLETALRDVRAAEAAMDAARHARPGDYTLCPKWGAAQQERGNALVDVRAAAAAVAL